MLKIQIVGEDVRLWVLIPQKTANAGNVTQALEAVAESLADLWGLSPTGVMLTGERLTPDGWQGLLWPVHAEE